MATTGNIWDTHDFSVKMLDWSATRGSRLAYTSRNCGRTFCHYTILSQKAWAVDGMGRALEQKVSDRWLSECCPRWSSAQDDEDRARLFRPLNLQENR
jgi:hypothetical protein